MLANRVRELTTTTGTGDITLAGALPGHIGFSDAFTSGDSVIYVIEDGDNYEIGTGTLVDAATLERTDVAEILVDGSYAQAGAMPINLSGNARIYCAATADFLLSPTHDADIIREVTPGAGVTADGVLLKDGGVVASSTLTVDVAVSGTTPIRSVSDTTGNFTHIELVTGNTPRGTLNTSGSTLQMISKGVLELHDASGQSLEISGGKVAVANELRVGDQVRLSSTLAGFPGLASGEAVLYASDTLGAVIGGRGSSTDIYITNRNGSGVMKVLANSVDVEFNGSVSLASHLMVLGQTTIGSSAAIAGSVTVNGDVNQYLGILQDQNINLTLGSVAGSDARIYLYGMANGQANAGDIDIRTSGNVGLVTVGGDFSVLGSVAAEGSVSVGTTLQVNGSATFVSSVFAGDVSISSDNLDLGGNTNTGAVQKFHADRVGVNQNIMSLEGWWNGTRVASVAAQSGTDTVGKGSGELIFTTAPDDVTGIVTRLRIEEGGRFHFHGNELTGLASMHSNVDTSNVNIAGGSSFNVGANLYLYGPSHSSQANNIHFKADASGVLLYDNSNAEWNFVGNKIVRVGPGNDVSMRIGADSTGSGVTDATIKVGRVGVPHYLNAEEPVGVWSVVSDGTENQLRMGGATSLMNAPTEISFWTAPDANTVTGSQQWKISNDGSLVSLGGTVIRRASDTGSLSLTGGTSTGAGANLILYGADHVSEAGNIYLRKDASPLLCYNDSIQAWDFVGFPVRGIDHIVRGAATDNLGLSGGTTPSTGGNIILYGETHASNPGDILFRDGANDILIWDSSASGWNFLQTEIINTPTIRRGIAASEFNLSGGSTNTLGGNVILYGESHATNASDIVFRSGTDTVALWDESNGFWTWNDKDFVNVGNVELDNIYGPTTTGLITVAGGTGITLGANIQLYAEGHATNANDIIFRNNSNNVLAYDANQNVWQFQGRDIGTVSSIARGSSTSFFTLSGGLTGSDGANIQMFAESHATQAYDIIFRQDTMKVLQYDHSEGVWDFLAKDIATSGIIKGSRLTFGVAPNGYYKNRFAGTLTSDGGNTVAAGLVCSVGVVGAAGDTSWLSTMVAGNGVGSTITTQGNSETISTVATLYLSEPGLSVGTGDTVNNACTLYIQNAPSEGAHNYSLFIAGGTARFDGNVHCGGVVRLLTDTTANRPDASTAGAGATMFDISLGKPIWSDGSQWVDAAGAAV